MPCAACYSPHTGAYLRGVRDDTRAALRGLARNRSALIVANLLFLPWFLVMVTGRNTNPWAALAEIFGIIAVYWFFTRRPAGENLPVQRPLGETALALALVAAWMLFRIGQYAHVYTLPQVSAASIRDVYETVIPKLLEMFLLPLAIWLGLRYTLRQLGLLGRARAWLPALVPGAVLVAWGLYNHNPFQLWDRIVFFYLGAGLPEEFLFRSVLQSRLQVLLASPAWALYLAALVFGASHIPINLSTATPENWVSAFESAFTFQLGVGFALGFAFQRTRNLLPLTVLHALIDAAP